VAKKVLAGILGMLFAATCVSCAPEEDIGQFFKSKPHVKVYIKEVIDRSGQSQFTAEAFKCCLAESIRSRRSKKFEIVDAADESDIQISGVIKKYRYLNTDNAAENCVEVEVDYNVVDTKTNKVLWSDSVDSYLKQIMSPEDSIPLICDKIGKQFMSKCYGKGKRRERTSLAM
jgi:hypothetical protein